MLSTRSERSDGQGPHPSISGTGEAKVEHLQARHAPRCRSPSLPTPCPRGPGSAAPGLPPAAPLKSQTAHESRLSSSTCRSSEKSDGVPVLNVVHSPGSAPAQPAGKDNVKRYPLDSVFWGTRRPSRLVYPRLSTCTPGREDVPCSGQWPHRGPPPQEVQGTRSKVQGTRYKVRVQG